MYQGTNLIMGSGTKKVFSRCLRNTNCITHGNYESEIIVVKNGVFNIRVGDENIELKQGQGAFIAPFEPHSFRSDKDNEVYIIMFSWDIAEGFLDFLKTREIKKHSFKISHDVLKIVDKILPDTIERLDLVSSVAVVSLLCNEAYQKCVFEEGVRRYGDILFESLDIIHNSYKEEITLESIAREMGIHPVTLSRRFSEGTGLSINRYINWIRCWHVAEMIENGADNLAETALAAGFGSIRSFNRAFVHFFGVTPSEYRKQNT